MNECLHAATSAGIVTTRNGGLLPMGCLEGHFAINAESFGFPLSERDIDGFSPFVRTGDADPHGNDV